MQSAESGMAQGASSVSHTLEGSGAAENAEERGSPGDATVPNRHNQEPSAEGESRGRKKTQFHGRGKGIGAVPKGKNSGPGWTGAGFDVDGRT